ncbi:MAG TPA: histidine phosphatase family protein [Ktedonobacteraceae bacterium]|jgi:probable phosphoglycerate mutase|nr:histidine phosphatase family protein [Ktedonobacteraceae bacterium]
MTHLYLIRHGQADGLQPGIIGSITPDSGLSRLGITQAERLRDRLATTGEIQADVLISSPLKRARETADIIAPALDLPVLVDDEVQELNLGECEGHAPARYRRGKTY